MPDICYYGTKTYKYIVFLFGHLPFESYILLGSINRINIWGQYYVQEETQKAKGHCADRRNAVRDGLFGIVGSDVLDVIGQFARCIKSSQGQRGAVQC